jgi:ATP-dependent Clp protease ATP-binding subunit ClpX
MPQATATRPQEPPELRRPEVFYDALDSLVGQDDLRVKLASTFFQYLLYLHEPEAGRPNLLVYGRSGSGKTYAVQQCVQAAGLPVTMPSAASLAPPGFRGRVFVDVLIDHWRRWKTDYGIIFLDEVDKWCGGSAKQNSKKSADQSRVSSELEMGGIALQQELLRTIEGELVTFTDDAKDVEELENVAFDTSHIFWIFGGAFVGLDRVIRQRLHNTYLPEEESWENAIPADFKSYGMTAELADRVSTWAWTKPLKVSQMMEILRDQDGPRWRRRFEAIGCVLELDVGALGACATHAWEMREGPRVARAMLNRSMDDVLALSSRHRAEALDWDGAVRVDASVVRSGRPSF